jgi:Flp pilus assembly protein CpaB
MMFTGPMIAIGVVASAVVSIGLMLAFGLVDLSGFRSEEPSTEGLIAVPTPARPIPAYTRVRRDHLWDTRNARLAVVNLPPGAVTHDMLRNLSDVIGRVLDHEKAPGYVFTESDFLPVGTREGIVAGIPAGKRAIRIAADKVEGLYGLLLGDRFDLLATMPIDAGRTSGSPTFNLGGAYGQQLALQARLSNWQKQATVRVIVQSGVIVEPMTTRGVPVLQSSLVDGSAARLRPVQEAVIAVSPEEVALLTEAMAVEARITTVPRSGRPDDPADSKTPNLRPVSPFTGPGTPNLSGGTDFGADSGAPPLAVVETIMGQTRSLTAVPRR